MINSCLRSSETLEAAGLVSILYRPYHDIRFVFYPDKDTKRLRYYSQFFNTAEMDSTFYDRFYSHMTKGTFIGISRATPEKFQFSIKVPETITHVKRLDVNKGAITHFEEFLDKISPLRTAKKLGAILFQLPPSALTVIQKWITVRKVNLF
ncbi:MAG: DUF72 domain-containing protein [Candidatus Nitrosopolaris sp.]